MKKLLLAFVLAVPLMAQTVPDYVMQSPTVCSTQATHPFTFYQLSCSVFFTNPSDGSQVRIAWRNVLNFNVFAADIVQPITTYRKYKVNYDMAPTPNQDGAFQVEWQVQDANGLYHFGIWTATWKNGSCGHVSCPILETSDTTEDQSTVAILD